MGGTGRPKQEKAASARAETPFIWYVGREAKRPDRGAAGMQGGPAERKGVGMADERDVLNGAGARQTGWRGAGARLAVLLGAAVLALAALLSAGCAAQPEAAEQADDEVLAVQDVPLEDADDAADEPVAAEEPAGPSADELRAELGIVEDFRPEFSHGPKGAEFQKYIVLHDTESDADPASIVEYWASSGNLVAAHFVVGKDGTIVQCVPLDEIAHHAGYGDAGHNASFGVEDESRDDMLGSVPIGDWAPDYGMNSYSIGIEMVHVGGSGDYPPEQLAALDKLIAYIDAYYGFESQITDHKAWRSGNSDTSPEFAGYFANYQSYRVHEAQ